MGRRRKGMPIHGWINLDKPSGMTSSDAVGKLKRHFNAAKVGHAGTLDPLATGILPIALGEATKTVPFVQDRAKTYRFTIRWGAARDTDDAEGAVIAESDRRPDTASITAALPAFIGDIAQVPPKFSAVKIAGERAYDLARSGEEIVLEERPVTVYSLALAACPDIDHAELEVISGSGFYVRALARDLGLKLGTYGAVAALRRSAVGPFTEDRASTLDAILAMPPEAALADHLLPVETALDDIPALALTEEEAAKLRNGQPVALLRRQDRLRLEQFRAAQADGSREPMGDEPADAALATTGGKPVALVRLDGAQLRPFRILNL